MMDEAQIDSFISEIRAEMELIRVFQNDPIVLTHDQENAILKHVPAQREEIRRKYIEEMKEHRRAWIFMMIYALEDKIRNSDLPAKTKAELTNVFDEIKNNHLDFTPATMKEVDGILEKTNEERKIEEKREARIGILTAAAASAIIAAPIIVSTVQHPSQTKTMDTVSGIPVLSENADPVYAQKAKAVGEKALTKVETNNEPVSLAAIQTSKELSNAQKKYAKAVLVEKQPELKKDLIIQENHTSNHAVNHSIAKQHYEKAKINLREAIKAERNAKTPEEKIIARQNIERLGRIVAFTEASRAEQFPSLLKKDAQSTKKMEEAQKEIREAKIALNNAKMAKRDAKTPQEEASVQASIEQAHNVLNKARQEIASCFNRPKYTGKEALVMKHVKKIKESEGVALSPQEISERLNNPTEIRIYTDIMHREHPELFPNQIKKEKETKRVADLRTLRRLFQKQKIAEIEGENGKVTSKDKKAIQKETNERFKPSIKKLIRNYSLPVQQNILWALRKERVNAA